MNKLMVIRFPIIVCVVLALLGALWAALMRVGWQMPPLPVPLAGQHGALMISGFLGTQVSLERAVALQTKWAYAAPLLAGLGGLALLLGLPPQIGRGLITLGSIGLVLIFAFIYRIHPTIDVVTMSLGSLMWLTGNLLWLLGALMLTQKGVPLDPNLLRLLPLHIEVLLFGWTLQLAMGIAYWILPRFSREPRYGNQTYGWLAFALINVGVIAAGVGQWLNAPTPIIMLGRAAEVLAVVCFTLHAWPRVKAIGV